MRWLKHLGQMNPCVDRFVDGLRIDFPQDWQAIDMVFCPLMPKEPLEVFAMPSWFLSLLRSESAAKKWTNKKYAAALRGETVFQSPVQNFRFARLLNGSVAS